MDIGIAGAGAVAKGYAAYLMTLGHKAHLWSPSGRGTRALAEGGSLTVTGAIEGQFQPGVCAGPADLAQCDVIVLALPANGHRAVIDALVPHLERRHSIIISGHLSFAALYLSKMLAVRGIVIPVIAWNTTALTAKMPSPDDVLKIGTIRRKIRMACIPSDLSEDAGRLCRQIFGDVFNDGNDLLSITLSNLNPQVHLAVTLCNLTRVENGEAWLQNSNITALACNFLEALDRERLLVGKAFGLALPAMRQTLAAGLGVDEMPLPDLYRLMVERGQNPPGPRDISTRYVLEDMPYGIHVTMMLARMAGVEVPVHASAIAVMGACYARDLAAGNDLLPAIGVSDIDAMRDVARTGYLQAS